MEWKGKNYGNHHRSGAETDHTAYKNTTYQMGVGNYGQLLHLYYGKCLTGDMRYLLTYYDRGFSGNPYEAECDKTYSMDALPQEYPCFGNGDFRSPAFVQKNADGSYCADLRYVSCEVCKGKYQIPGLPAAYDETGAESETLKVYLEDAPGGVRVTLLYGVFAELDIITRAVQITNCGTEAVHVEKAASAALDFMTGEFDVIHFHGRHGMERIFERTPVEHANQVFGSRRGASGHQQNPFVMLSGKQTGEDAGECYGCMLLYSGNFKAEAVLSYSANGFSALSWNLHRLIRNHICRSAYRDTKRPVLINNWEATYFDFTGEKIIEIAKQAAELGVEMLVLDDGWFGKRDDDLAGLGDWTVNEKKLGMPLSQVAEKIRALGMKFGIWIEPEMVCEDSDLYREHPDWAFTIPGRKPVRARYQLVLDYSRKEVVDGIFTQIAKVLDETKADYVKMDMNRHLTDVWSKTAGEQNQGAILHRYMLGVYDFLERLHERYPALLIEGCSGGGGRFDAGMLYYTPQIWCSDNTDAIERVKIQYGTSFAYPSCTVGSHVSAVPNHQTGRTTELATRAAVAMAGSFGYELDLNLLTEEKEQVRAQIKNYHRFEMLIRQGRYYRLTDVWQKKEYAAWEYCRPDGSEALVTVVTLDTQCNPATEYVKLRGLGEDKKYRVEVVGMQTGGENGQWINGTPNAVEPEYYTGAQLVHAGLPSVAAQHCVLTGILSFSNFLPKSQKQLRLRSTFQQTKPEPCISLT